jgi:hypothetical protein
MGRLPTHRPPTHPGEMLLELLPSPVGYLTLAEAAKESKLDPAPIRDS